MINNVFIEPRTEDYPKICQRPKKSKSNLDETISEIFRSVKSEGDNALRFFTSKFDGVALNELSLSENEIEQSSKGIPESLKKAIIIARENISKFHKAQLSSGIEVETSAGVICRQRSIGIEKVGIYIPGGTAPLFSTVLMLAVPAQLAGCGEIILCSPPDKTGKIHPAILYAAKLCGISKIYRVGGAQAIAALTLGTETIPSVYKIFGPGNQYVTAAKQFAQNFGVGMDLPAGPSELLIYANDSGVPEYIAADLLSQAEHGIDSQVILVANRKEIIDQVNNELSKQVKVLPRREIAESALRNSKSICISNPQMAFEFINEYGPEHLILACENYHEYVDHIKNAGSVFLGNFCPESAGDYASGTNHTLPTDGWAKSYNGVNVDSFSKKITFQEISKKGIQYLGKTIIEMAKHEMLEGHAKAVEVRLKRLNMGDNE